jgi:hypothetical protein
VKFSRNSIGEIEMQSYKILFTSLATSSFLASSLLADGSCASVYSNAVANVSIETKERSIRSFYFNFYCEQSGTSKSFAAGGGIAFPIEGIPLEANGNASWSQTDLNKFCKIGNEKNYSHGTDFAFGRYVVTDALKSFNECRALEREGLIVTHQVAPPKSFAVHGSFTGVIVRASLDTVTYDSDLMECTSTNFGKNKKSEVLDGSVGYPIGTSNFNIACERKPFVARDKKYFPWATFQMSTSLGPYTVIVPGDHHFGFELASQSQAAHAEAIASLTQSRAETAKVLKTLSNRIKTLKPEIFTGY